MKTLKQTFNQSETLLSEWKNVLETALSDPLGALIQCYGKAVRASNTTTISDGDLDALLTELGKSKTGEIFYAMPHGGGR